MCLDPKSPVSLKSLAQRAMQYLSDSVKISHFSPARRIPNIQVSVKGTKKKKKKIQNGDKPDPASYRPISLTCVLCKVLEHIMASNLSKHVSDQNILFGIKHWFREKRSCETQLTMLVDEPLNMQMGKQTALILLDFFKAVAHIITVSGAILN